MSRTVLAAYLLAAVFVIAAIVAAVAQPMHWKRTVAVAVVLAVVAGVVGVTQGRRALP